MTPPGDSLILLAGLAGSFYSGDRQQQETMPEQTDKSDKIVELLRYGWLIPAALLLAILPWPVDPLPHLVQKIGMLADGTLTKPIDIFDLVWHGWPILLLVVRGGYDVRRKLGNARE